MVRAFTDEPVDPALIDEFCDLARRAPSAGNTQATDLVVADTPEAVERYWSVTLPPERREGFRWQSLLRAPVLVLVVVHPGAYPARYREQDKEATGRGAGEEAWPVPYWWVDAGAVAQNLLLLVHDSGLGACLFGAFDHEAAVRTAFGVPDDRRLVATVAIGHPAPGPPGRSAVRARRPLEEILHRGRW